MQNYRPVILIEASCIAFVYMTEDDRYFDGYPWMVQEK